MPWYTSRNFWDNWPLMWMALMILIMLVVALLVSLFR